MEILRVESAVIVGLGSGLRRAIGRVLVGECMVTWLREERKVKVKMIEENCGLDFQMDEMSV